MPAGPEKEEPFALLEGPRWKRLERAAWVMELRRWPVPPPAAPLGGFSEDMSRSLPCRVRCLLIPSASRNDESVDRRREMRRLVRFACVSGLNRRRVVVW